MKALEHLFICIQINIVKKHNISKTRLTGSYYKFLRESSHKVIVMNEKVKTNTGAFFLSGKAYGR